MPAAQSIGMNTRFITQSLAGNFFKNFNMYKTINIGQKIREFKKRIILILFFIAVFFIFSSIDFQKTNCVNADCAERPKDIGWTEIGWGRPDTAQLEDGEAGYSDGGCVSRTFSGPTRAVKDRKNIALFLTGFHFDYKDGTHQVNNIKAFVKESSFNPDAGTLTAELSFCLDDRNSDDPYYFEGAWQVLAF